MADIRINALPLATGPTAPSSSDNVAIDGSSTRKSPLSGLADAIRPIASQAEAEAGINSVKAMSPITTKQSIASEVGVTIASQSQVNAALPAANKATQAQAVEATDNTNYMTALSGAQQADGRSSAVITGGLSRTAPARFGDVVDLDERLPGDGDTPINGTPLSNLLTYMAANPNKTYRSRKNRKYLINAATSFPSGIKLRLEGAEFYLGASLTAGTTALTLGADTDTDEIRLRVLGANTVYRGILVGDRFRGGLVAYSDSQQANSGNQLYRAIRIAGNDCDLDYVESRFFDYGVLVHGESASNVGTVIRRLKAQSYCNAVKIRDVSDFRLQDYTVTGRSANGLSNPGQNGVLVEGAQYSQFHDGYIEGSPEHGFRFGGFGSFVNTKACKVGGLNVKSPGQTGVKAYTGALANVMQDMSFSDITVIDAGDNGDAVGFNDFGYMLQNINGLHGTGLTVKNRDLAVCALDGFYLSSITRGEMNGLQVYSAARNAMRISEYNDNGTNGGSINTLDIIGLQSESHAAAGVYLEFPGSQAIRHLAFKDTHLIGGTNGFDSNAAVGRFVQQAYFEGIINGQSGAKFNLPSTANVKTLDLLDPIANDAVAYAKVGTDLKRDADVTFTVGSGGQFSTINAALAAASKLVIRPYTQSGFKVEIRLLTGFQMAEQVLCKDVDLSYITITSVDPVVTIVRSALTVPVNADEGTGGTSIGHIPAFGGIRAKLPTIGCLFQMNTSGTATDRSGVYIANHSHISVIPNCGIQNAAHTGLFCLVNSSADAPKTIWKNAGNGCVRAESTSFIALASGFSVAETPGTGFGSDCSGSGGDGILCKEASLVDARAANVTGAANDAIHARRGSTINATQASASSTNMSGVRADRGSTVYFNLGVVTGAGTTGILCSRASRCDAEDAVVTSSADGIQAWQSSVINANNIVVTATAGRGVYALDGSTINARGGTANNCAIAGFVATAASTINCPSASATGCAIGINAREGSTINANGAVATGHTSSGIYSFEGSTINARGANARRAGVDTTSDFLVGRGSILNFNNSKTGGVSQTVNTLTAEGIIFS